LNIQNYVTNIDAGLTSINADKSMGRVHKGFWDAMGSVENTPSTSHASVHVELSDASLSQALSAACQGVVRIFSLLSTAIFKNVVDPIDASWAGYSPNVRYQSAYMQSEDWILQLIGTNADSKKKRIYITGHSLGGALATG
jgi:hypothetical protein